MGTLLALGTSEHRLKYRELALTNLKRWRELPESAAAALVQFPVFCGDWGEVTLQLTQRYREKFAVLNMANAYVAGGGYTEGMPAQEENMFRRTDCHYAVDEYVYDQQNDRYKTELTDLI